MRNRVLLDRVSAVEPPADETVALAGLLRRDAMAARSTPIDRALIDRAIDDHVAPLLFWTLKVSGNLDSLSESDRRALTRSAHEALLADSIALEETSRVLDRMAREGIHPLVFKGAALAPTLYPESWLRPRGDCDILVRAADAAAAGGVLETMGYGHACRPSGVHVTHQARYASRRRAVEFAFDVHWRIADPAAFAAAITYDELEKDAMPLPGSAGRVIGDVHALLVAAIHRAAHHFDSEMLLFLYDIDLIARGLGDESWTCFAHLAEKKQLRAVCARALTLARGLFATPVPGDLVARLTSGMHDEPTARYVAGGLRRVDVLRSDMQVLEGWRARAALLREHLLPPPSYILRRYGSRRAVLLPAFYVHRIVWGAARWFRPLADSR